VGSARVSGVWVRCPNCDLEIKCEMSLAVEDGDVKIDVDYLDLVHHARNCAEENG
jgi:transcription elongation factor Elf1